LTEDLSAIHREEYYKILLVLFKPTTFSEKQIMGSCSSYKLAYLDFIHGGGELADEAVKHEKLWANYYANKKSCDASGNDITHEDKILHDHPFANPENDPKVNPGYVNTAGHGPADFNNESNNEIDALLDAGLSEDDILQLLPRNESLEIGDELKAHLQFNCDNSPQIMTEQFNLPSFQDYDSYYSALVNPLVSDNSEFSGTTKFCTWNEDIAVKIKLLKEYFEPIPWVDTQDLGRPDLSELQPFSSITEISKAMRLDFWQHTSFETYARHLLHRFTNDIKDSDTNFKFSIHSQSCANIKPHLVGYLGGAAGSGDEDGGGVNGRRKKLVGHALRW
jgi:hypothetical protein